jgi:hypothetical protein
MADAMSASERQRSSDMSSKMGPKEAALRAQREARVLANKRLIDSKTKVKAKAIGGMLNIKLAKRGGRGR